MNINKEENDTENNIMRTDKEGFKELIKGVQMFFYTYHLNDFDMEKTIRDKTNETLTIKQMLFFKDVSIIVKKRFDELYEILKELDIKYLSVYLDKSREEAKKNPEKYDLILNVLIGRLGLLYEYIKLNEYVEKDVWIKKYMPLICLEKHNKENVIFLDGDLTKEETKEIITNFLKD